jgi:hypothetical protein
VQGPLSGFVMSSTKVLEFVSAIANNGAHKDVQNWVADEEHEQTQRENGQATKIDYTSPRKDIAVSLVLLVGIGIVQVVVLLHIFRE